MEQDLQDDPRSDGKTLELSVVVPVYGCRECLRALHERLRRALESITPMFEIIFVDDRSPDHSWEVLSDLARSDPAVKAYRLSRNFGQHAAITAGLAQTSGRWVVVMDCDLEEPPEEIPRLYAKAMEGNEIVHTVRKARQHSRFRRTASHAYRYFMLETDSRTDYSTLSMLSRKVVDAFLRLRDNDREYLLLLDWLGFTQATIEFEHQKRSEGESSYTLSRLVRVALNGVFFRTTVLLRWVVALGFLIAVGGALLAAYNVIEYVAGKSPTGYTSLAVLLLLLTGFIIVSMGVIGLYVGRIFEQVRERPLYVIDSYEGAPRDAEGRPGAARDPSQMIEESVAN
jgi:polyisoprenyl-phosphate glycosyltransferase